MTNWTEEVTAVATVVLAVGAVAAIGAAAFDFDLIETLLAQQLVDRYDLWHPSIDAIGGRATYPNITHLADKMRVAIA